VWEVKVKYQTLISKTISELYQLYNDLKKETLNLRMQAAASQITNTARRQICRRDIARIQTRLQQLKNKVI